MLLNIITIVTFKDLKKRVSLGTTTAAQQQSMLFERLQNKPFWIWDVVEHKQEDIRIKGDCCFNHIIGLPQKNGVHKPLYDYEKISRCMTMRKQSLTLWLLKMVMVLVMVTQTSISG
jgi:hypothetical protein